MSRDEGVYKQFKQPDTDAQRKSDTLIREASTCPVITDPEKKIDSGVRG